MAAILTEINSKKKDAILYKAWQWTVDTDEDPYLKAEAVKKIAKLISNIRDGILRTSYVELIGNDKKTFKIKFKMLNDLVTSLNNTPDEIDGEEITNWDKLPAWMNRDEIESKGFSEVRTDNKVGYYAWSGTGKMEISNFIIKPLFQVRGKGIESRHIFEIQNGQKTATLDVPSKVFVSVEAFETELVAEGVLFFGNKSQLKVIAKALLPQFPVCDEIKILGWQPEGFFSYVDSYYVPEKDYNQPEPLGDDGQPVTGLKTIGSGGVYEVGKKHFLVPAASSVYQDLREDSFAPQRVLRYRPSPVDFKTWANKIHTVYGEDGLVGIAYLLCTLFRDVLFNMDHNFPHLYGYGERSSGKSKWAESLTAVCYTGRAAFNLNSGTDAAFFEYVKAFRNCLAHLNEFDDKVVKEEWFQAIKGFFDGEGRQRTRMGSTRHNIETQRAESGVVLTGQYLSTKDDNSVVTRSIIRAFHERQFTDQEKKDYDELKQWETEGLSGLMTDILQYRSEVRTKYYEVFNEMLGNWRRNTTGEFNSRIFQNWCHLASMWKLFSAKLSLPVPADVFTNIAYKEAKDLSNFVRSSDTLNDFWNTVVFLLDEGKLTSGWDFRIETWVSCNLRKGDGTEYVKEFDGFKKLLIIRLDNVHKHYQKSHKERTGKEGMTIDNLKHYFSNRPYYIGQIKQLQFKRYVAAPVETVAHSASPLSVSPQVHVQTQMVANKTTTSAYVFDYDLLGCELDRSDDEMQPELFN
jgi:DNA primase